MLTPPWLRDLAIFTLLFFVVTRVANRLITRFHLGGTWVTKPWFVVALAIVCGTLAVVAYRSLRRTEDRRRAS